jgi:hypothetical protein
MASRVEDEFFFAIRISIPSRRYTNQRATGRTLEVLDGPVSRKFGGSANLG